MLGALKSVHPGIAFHQHRCRWGIEPEPTQRHAGYDGTWVTA